ncbi:CDGSH iron-sulfur domain-containing protein [Plasmodium brasilianum]|uniref:CDGSH iron-sulfur domain-containing protein, putative n=2 Tax=Plasmodium (Plasmodium) TaxID=418103 RepID=A0A1D3PB10_PLAMA|nr:CDGSH iron-sulfur domain-containing protein, putative [Plasmodium malariae]KAI4839050.1 CDGSH iron-sulfur domain-containing protein [Plasmodium brasilianum]SCN12405.1 CDGSH iron-sulfur domain-containing protein, putative [Plasmodium malariae]
MKDPCEYLDKINFNTKRFPQYTHLIESCPSENENEKIVRICRCWQSSKFPYCDDTHKIFIENGDSVGPYVAKLVSYKLSDEEKLKKQKYNEKYIKINNKLSSDKSSVLNVSVNCKPYINYKLKKSVLLSFVVLTSALLYGKKEKLINIYSTN